MKAVTKHITISWVRVLLLEYIKFEVFINKSSVNSVFTLLSINKDKQVKILTCNLWSCYYGIILEELFLAIPFLCISFFLFHLLFSIVLLILSFFFFFSFSLTQALGLPLAPSGTPRHCWLHSTILSDHWPLSLFLC